MASLRIRDMEPHDESFVGSCTHVDETDEWSASCRRRIGWLRSAYEQGMRVKVAVVDEKQAGLLYLLPIEIAPTGPLGRDLSVIQCLTVRNSLRGNGAGHALVEAAEQEARKQGRKGIVVTAFYHDFWFMPAPFFEECGFTAVRRQGDTALLWKVFDDSAEPPQFLKSRYRFVPAEGKVAIDLFWSRSCLTSDTEAERVREVAAEFGDAVALSEHCSDLPEVRAKYGIWRAIFVQGQEKGWGHEAPKDRLREVIRRALALAQH